MPISETYSAAIDFRVTVEEFVEAQRLYCSELAPVSLRTTYHLKLPIGVLCIVLAGVLIAFGGTEVAVTPAFIIGAYLILSKYVLYTRKVRKQFTKYPDLQGNQHVEITGNEIVSKAEHSQGRMGWELINAWAESQNVLILRVGPEMFFTLPKQAFSTDQLNGLRELLSEKVGRPGD